MNNVSEMEKDAISLRGFINRTGTMPLNLFENIGASLTKTQPKAYGTYARRMSRLQQAAAKKARIASTPPSAEEFFRRSELLKQQLAMPKNVVKFKKPAVTSSVSKHQYTAVPVNNIIKFKRSVA